MKDDGHQIDFYDQIQSEFKASEDTIQMVKDAFNWPSCWTCIHAIFDEDRSVGIPLHLDDCRRSFGLLASPDLADLADLDDLDEEELAHSCGCWQINWRAVTLSW